MAITARNYASQAVKALGPMHARLCSLRRPLDAAGVLAMQSLVQEAEHFAIPDGGFIFNDGFRGLEGLPLRLPYPIITIEYYQPPEDLSAHPELRPAPKRLVVAAESEALLKALGMDQGPFQKFTHKNVGVLVMSLCTLGDDRDNWVPQYCGALIPRSWGNPDDGVPLEEIKPYGAKTMTKAQFAQVDILGDACADLRGGIPREEFLRLVATDVGPDCRVVMELCEALACSNVSAPVVKPRKAGQNKSPLTEKGLLYSVHRLMVETPRDTGSRPSGGGTHASPRQHLRRGHVRKLPSDKRIWVQSCVVGSAERGKVVKDYGVVPKEK